MVSSWKTLRGKLLLGVVFGTLFPTGCHQEETKPSEGELPNVLLILADDLGWRDLGCYGSTFYETPNIDSLATQGMSFSDAYAACPVCSPSRGAILTGRAPARTGLTAHINPTGRHRYPEDGPIVPPDDFFYLPLEEVTLAEALSPLGYRTLHVGKWHLGGDAEHRPEQQGFQESIGAMPGGSPDAPLHHYTYFFPYFDVTRSPDFQIPGLTGGSEGEFLTELLTSETVSWLEEYDSDQPFFLYFSPYAVHTPLEAPEALVRKYEAKLERDDSQFSPEYAGMIESLDTGIGRILAAIDQRGWTDNTIVLFTSDNGGTTRATRNTPLRSGKGFLYEGGIRVPLIVRWPGRVPEGQSTNVPAISHDLFPTVVEMIGATGGSRPLDGSSLVPVLEGGTLSRQSLYWYYPHYSPQAKRPGGAIRDGDFKLIENYDPAGFELFNLADDPSEENDLASKMEEKVVELEQKLETWLASVEARQHTDNPNYGGN
jgi:arylsulfatase A-like enzyme